MVSYFVLSFPHEMSWIRPGSELSNFLRLFLPSPVLQCPFHNVFFECQKETVPNIFFIIFSVCNKTIMICSREYNCTENEKTELISFHLPDRAVYTSQGFFFALIFFHVT